MKKITFLFLFIAFTTATYAQLYEVGVGAGVLHYKGDVTPRFKPFAVKPGANLFFRYNLSRAVSLKASGLFGYFYGDDKEVHDPFNQARGFEFNTQVQEGNVQLEYNFLNFRTNASRITSEWTPYVFGGIGFSQTLTSSSYVDHQNFNTRISFKQGSSSGIVIPFGIGFKKKWNENWNWGIEFGTRKTFRNDKIPSDTNFNNAIDNFYSYPQGIDANDPLVNSKLQQGLVLTNDMYYYTNFSISYVFYKVHCPAPKH